MGDSSDGLALYLLNPNKMNRLLSLRVTRRFYNPPSYKKSILLGRPLSPEIAIYQPQLTWVPSIVFRITSVGLATGFYAASGIYAFVPIDSTSLVTSIYQFPTLVLLAKAALSYSLSYHFVNGIRHLLWDAGFFLSVKGVYAGAYVLLGSTAVLGSWLLLK